jgi:hypothetical protein
MKIAQTVMDGRINFMSIQTQILDILKSNPQPITIEEFLLQFKERDTSLRDSQIRAGLFPLLSTNQIVFEGRQIRLI